MSEAETQSENQNENRRPLKVRGAKLPQRFARWLGQKNITPNQISIASVFFAALAAGCLFSLPAVSQTVATFLAVLAAVFIQFRLLCNLFDGMVAVEGGKSTASGELFNDIPDRIADPLILIAAGYATTVWPWSDVLGWAAGLGAVLTAYVRTLAAAAGAPVDFRGPMAKQHRMALITFACVLTAVEPMFWTRGWALVITLVVIIIGCAVTFSRRSRSAYLALENGSHV